MKYILGPKCSTEIDVLTDIFAVKAKKKLRGTELFFISEN
jgi:hypothetical protein